MAQRRLLPKLKVKEVNADLWKDFERLFEAKGSAKYCWYMAWRPDQKDLRRDRTQAAKP